MFSSESKRSGPGAEHVSGDRAARRTQFAKALEALGAQPSREALERLLHRAGELQLTDDTAPELIEARARLAAAAARDAIALGQLPSAVSLHPLPPGDRCHFIVPVRFGRRRSDQYGHLSLTSGWLRFHGALDLSVAWGEVSRVERTTHEVLVALHDSRRLLRFHCPSAQEAATAHVIASHLAAVAQEPHPAPGSAGTPLGSW